MLSVFSWGRDLGFTTMCISWISFYSKNSDGAPLCVCFCVSQRNDKVPPSPPDLGPAELVEVMTVLSKPWQSLKLIPKNSFFCKVIVESFFHRGFWAMQWNTKYEWHICVNSGDFRFQAVSDSRLPKFAICCFDGFFLKASFSSANREMLL